MSNLAAKLGVDQSNLSKKLKNDPKVSLLESIASALEIPVSTFFPDQLPAHPAGILDMEGKRYALVPVPIEVEEKSGAAPESHNLAPEALDLTPEALQGRIFNMIQQCLEDGQTRAIYGYLLGHLVVVLHDSESKRYLRLFGEDGFTRAMDYPSRAYEGWEGVQLAERIVHDIIFAEDL